MYLGGSEPGMAETSCGGVCCSAGEDAVSAGERAGEVEVPVDVASAGLDW